ncbi:MAG: HEAT repeat domain-containing protein [Proteobacteria bacterium]|nr:HEAT repeat domain-containing protein [Pseudomonadota bacterium]
MADTDIKQKSLDALVIMNTAIKNVRLYPPTSATIISTIERLHQAFQEMLARENPIVFAESEKSILICGNPLNQKDQEKIQVTALLNILLGFGLKSISFDKGLEKAELSTFTEILSRKPDVIKSEGGLPQILAENNITHIYLDQKVYVAMDKDHKIISSLDIKDDQIAEFFISTNPELSADPQKLQEMAKDPERLSQAFQTGLKQLMAQKGSLSDNQLTESLGNMVGLLDKVAGSLMQEDKENISNRIGEAIVTADPDMALELTTQNMEHLFGGVLRQYLISKLDEIKYYEIQKTGEGGASDGQSEAGTGQTGRGQGDGSIGINGEGTAQSGADSQKKSDFKNKLIRVSEKMSLNLKENEKTLLDKPLMSILPKIIEQLIAHKEQETMEKIIRHLVDNLFSEKADVRAHAAKALTDIIESLPPERKREMIESLSGRLIEWIKIETSVTPVYKTVCNYLQNIAQDFINQLRYAETIPLLDMFNDINSGTLEKNDAIHEVSAQLILNLATEENITLLFKEFNTNEHDKKDDAGKILLMFGDITIKHMLDTLEENSDGNERVRIMHLIIGTGQRAIPLVRERINENAPWHYLWNMAYILGQIGNEESAGALQPLLRHENERLRHEALKSISRTGGKRRGQLLITALNGADEKFKLRLIEALGNAKAADIVPDLLNILITRPFVTTAARIQMEEKICVALGDIGSPEAIPALSEISESKSFFRVSSYPENVKTAAARALESIRKKKTEAIPKLNI